jgi:diadenosine tetraphosphatase ApaH/serine/threonine PP2A family protein phosphatase
MEQQSIDMRLCLGDMVGYGAEPSECIKLVREMECFPVAGNHDHAAVDLINLDYFNIYARQAAFWTRDHISDDDKQFILSLPFQRHFDNFAVVHGTLHTPEIFNYINSVHDALCSLSSLDKPACFMAHSHVPLAFFDTQPLSYTTDTEIQVDPNSKTLVNVGSVGQPRDEDPRACYVIYDDLEHMAFFRRVEYDIDSAAKKIIAAGLPEILALRLAEGR